MNGATLSKNPSLRMLLTGMPGAGKTGCIASLADAGYKIRLLDFDGNYDSLIQFTSRDKRANIDVLPLEDVYGQVGQFVGVKGVPTAFTRALKAMDFWETEGEDGTKVSLGSSKDWGPDVVVVLDGFTGLSQACFSHAQAMMNKTPLNTTQAVWGLAIQNQLNFIKRLTSAVNRHHVIAISHLKMVGPKLQESGDTILNQELKAAAAELIPTRLYPTALGQQLPQTIAGEFPIVVNLNVQARGKSMIRGFQVLPVQEMDIKVPAKDLAQLQGAGVEDGLLKIFKACGAKLP